jgi:hypothetical protein
VLGAGEPVDALGATTKALAALSVGLVLLGRRVVAQLDYIRRPTTDDEYRLVTDQRCARLLFGALPVDGRVRWCTGSHQGTANSKLGGKVHGLRWRA